MKNDNTKSNQLQINFEIVDSIKEVTYSTSNNNTPKNAHSAKVISFNHVVNHVKKIKEDELRKFVLHNTKSF